MKKQRDQKEKKQKEPLDTQTTFADMNVEGFSWYDKHKKQGRQKIKVDKKEYRQIVKAAFAAYLPMLLIVMGVGVVIFLIAYVWLGN